MIYGIAIRQERLRHQRAELCGIGAIGDDEVLAVDEAVGARWIGRARQRHRKGALANVMLSHSGSPGFRGRWASFAPVVGEIEGGDALLVAGTFEDFGMAQRADGVVVSGTPMLLH